MDKYMSAHLQRWLEAHFGKVGERLAARRKIAAFVKEHGEDYAGNLGWTEIWRKVR